MRDAEAMAAAILPRVMTGASKKEGECKRAKAELCGEVQGAAPIASVSSVSSD